MTDNISKNLWSAEPLKYMILAIVQVELEGEVADTQSEEVGFPTSVVGQGEDVFRKLKAVSTLWL